MPNLVWDLLWKDRGVVHGLNNVSAASDKATRNAKAFKVAVGVGLVALGAAAVKFGADSVRAYSEAQSAQQRLGFAFQKFPKLADTNQVALQRLNTELQKKTRFDDDATAAAQAQLAQYGLTGKQITQLTPLMQDYAAKTGKDLPTAAKDMGKAVLGSGRALKAIGLNFKDSGTAAGNLDQLMGGLRTQVGGFAEKEGKTAAGQLEILHNQFGELQEAAGKQLLPAVTAVVGGLTTLVEIVGDNSDVIVPLVGTVGGLTAAMWLGSKAAKAFSAAQGLLSAAANSNSRVIGGLASVVSKAGPWGLAIGAGATLLGLFAGKQALAERETRQFTDSLTYQKGVLDANSKQMLVKKLADEGALDAATRAGVSEAEYVRALVQGGPARDRLITQLYDSEAAHHASADALEGNVTEHLDLATAAGTAADQLRLTGDSLDESKRKADQASTAYAGTTTATEDLGKKQHDLKVKLDDAKDALQGLLNKMTVLRTGALDMETAHLAWEEAIDGVTASAKENGRSLSDNTEKGRANRRAIISAMQALDDNTKADFKHASQAKDSAKATKAASARYKENREALIRSALGARFSKDEVHDMVAQYLKTPKNLDTEVTADTKKARAQIKKLREALALVKSRDAWIKFSTNAGEVAKTYGVSLQTFRGSGRGADNAHHRAGGYTGNLPPWQSAGEVHGDEYVISSPSRRRFESRFPGYLRSINERGDLPGYRGGGVVAHLNVGTRGVIAVPDMAAIEANLARRIGGRLGDRLGPTFRGAGGGGAFGGSGAVGVGHLAQAALARVGDSWDIGTCLRFVRMMAGAPGGTYDATAAWGNARYKHRGDRNPPSGVPVYWGGGHGHIAVSIGGGQIVGTDFPRVGHIGRSTLGRITSAWGKPYRGWANDVNGVVTSKYGLSSGGVLGVGVGEHGPERVLSAAQTRTFDRMVRVMDSRGAGNTYMVNISAPNYIGSRQELRKTMVDMVRSGAFEVVKR